MNLRKTATAISAAMIAIAAGLGISGCERDKHANIPATGSVTEGTTKPRATVGQTVDDAATTAKVKTVMLADPDVKGLQINVDTKDGVVTLSGTVDNPAQAEKAVQIATRAEGVKAVNNNLNTRG